MPVGDDERSMSLEKRSDRDDVSTLGTNENWKMSRSSSKFTCNAWTRSAIPWMLRGCSDCHGSKVFRPLIVWRSHSWSRFRWNQTLLPWSNSIPGNQLHLR